VGKLTEAQSEVLTDLYFENDRPPEEKWFERGVWDPMHTMASLRGLASKKLINLDVDDQYHGGARFRFTPAGRATLTSEQKR
jgi:hypothetical protein